MSPLPSKIIGLDLSLTSTGVAKLDVLSGGCDLASISTEHVTSTFRGVRRLARLYTILEVRCAGAELVVIEGYSMGSRNSQSFSIGELGGVIRLMLYGANIPTVVLPPTSLKKFATGSGIAQKPAMVLALFKKWGIERTQDDEADAALLAIAGAYLLDKPGLPPLTALQRDALTKAETVIAPEASPGQVRLRSRPEGPAGELQRVAKIA